MCAPILITPAKLTPISHRKGHLNQYLPTMKVLLRPTRNYHALEGHEFRPTYKLMIVKWSVIFNVDVMTCFVVCFVVYFVVYFVMFLVL